MLKKTDSYENVKEDLKKNNDEEKAIERTITRMYNDDIYRKPLYKCMQPNTLLYSGLGVSSFGLILMCLGVGGKGFIAEHLLFVGPSLFFFGLILIAACTVLTSMTSCKWRRKVHGEDTSVFKNYEVIESNEETFTLRNDTTAIDI